MTRLRIDGPLDAAAVARLAAAVGEEVVLDLSAADPPAPADLARAVDALDALLALGARVVLIAPPQLLAHTLYKAGRLRDARLRLEDPRQEEPYAG